MKTTFSIIQNNRKTIIFDITVFLLIYLIPTFSHLLPIPIYIFDPMRIMVFANYILVRNNQNSIIVAITIPLFSALVAGHPPLFKAFLISLELVINVILFIKFSDKLKLAVPFAMVLSILLSKFAYYLFKYILISFGFIDSRLVTTNLYIQAITIIGITLIFSIVYRKNK